MTQGRWRRGFAFVIGAILFGDILVAQPAAAAVTHPIPRIDSPPASPKPEHVTRRQLFETKEPTPFTPKAYTPRGAKPFEGYVEGKSKEIMASRTDAMKVYRNADGTYTSFVYAAPIHYKGASGEWRDIDTRIVRDADGFHNVSGPAGVRFAGRADAENIFRITREGTALAFGLEDAAGDDASVSGSKIVYEGIRAGVNLELEMMRTRVKETLVFTEPPSDQAAATFRFSLALEGLSPEQQPDGSIWFSNADGAVVLRVPPARAWDSSEGEGDVAASMRLVQDGATWSVEVSLDHAWLAADERVYPVYLDPTVDFDDSNGATDAFVAGATPTTNYNSYLDTSLNPDQYVDMVGNISGKGDTMSFVKFNLSSIANTEIIDATLNLWCIWNGSPSSTPYVVHPVSSNWSASTINYNTTVSLDPTTVTGSALHDNWSATNVETWVQNWVSSSWPNYGVEIDNGANQGNAAYGKKFGSEENPTHPPYLSVTYNRVPGTTTLSSPADGASVHTLTPTLGFQATDPDGDPIHYRIQACVDAAFTRCLVDTWYPTAPGSGAGAPSGSPYSYTIEAGDLVSNLKHYWRVAAADDSLVGAWSSTRSFTTTNESPPAPSATSPAADAVVATRTPTLEAGAVTDPDADAVTYGFRIMSSPSGGGMIVDSGFASSTSWTAPAGSLSDGRTYYWVPLARDSLGAIAVGTARAFRVDLGLGSRPARAYDSLGSTTVNLGTGNVFVQAATPSIAAVGGSLGLTFAYNSAKPSNQGLTGYYYNDDGDQSFEETDQLVVTRTDPQLSFDWAWGSPYASVNSSTFLVRWTGYVTVPTTGSYKFGSRADDGTRVWVSNMSTPVFERWVTQSAPAAPQYGSAISLTANQPTPIKVEYFEKYGDASFELWANGPFGEGNAITDAVVPSSWFTSDVPGLPDGWTMSVDADGDLTYVSANIGDGVVTLMDSTGSSHVYTWSGTAWTPPAGEDGILTNDTSIGLLVLHADDGRLYNFNVDGTLAGVTSAVDDRNPAALTYTWSGTPSRLKTITDPVSNRALTLWYGDEGQCPSGSAAPPFMLCKVDLGSSGLGATELYYDTGKHLSRIVNPGATPKPTTDFGYTVYSGESCYAGAKPEYQCALLTSVRDPLTNDLIAGGVFTDSSTHNTIVAYTGGRASSVTAPTPASGAARPKRTYEYFTNNTRVHVVGLPSEPSGYAREVTFNTDRRVAAERDLGGHLTTYDWDSADRLTRTQDPTNIVSTTTYDSAGRPTNAYGPGAATEFNGDGTSATAPRTRLFYDESTTGLGAAWWSNPNLVGPTTSHTTLAAWNTWTGAPTANIPADGFSARFTGEVDVSSAGGYGFTGVTNADDGMRLYIDDSAVIDRWDTYSAAVLRDSPRGYWRLGESSGTTASDASGNAADGTYQNGYTLAQSGALRSDANTSASFNGTDGRVSLGRPSALNLTSAWTLEAWIYPTSTANGASIISEDYASDAQVQYALGVGMNEGTNGSAKLKVGFYNSSSWKTAADNVDVSLNRWTHVVGSWDGTTLSLYKNGQLVAASAPGGAPTVGTQSFYIGKRHDAGGVKDFFPGRIDEPAVYPVALSPARVAAHFDAGRARMQFEPYGTQLSNSASMYWRLAETSGGTAYDSIGSRNGTYVGSTTLGQAARTSATGAVTLSGSSSQYVISPNLKDASTSRSATTEVWFKPTGPGVVVSELGQSTPNTGFHDSQLEVTAGGQVRARAWNLAWMPLGAITFGTWHHAVVRYDDATKSMTGFLDGVRSDEAVGTRVTPWDVNAANGLYYALGAQDSTHLGHGVPFKGSIDEFAWFNSALTDQDVFDHYQAGAVRFAEGISELSQGKHRIRVDFRDPASGGDARLEIDWTLPSGASQVMPMSSLNPRYGLLTKSIDPDGKTTTIGYATPELGLATSSVMDPGTLNLTSTTEYESPGAPGTFLRPIARTLPKGASSRVQYVWWGGTETADNPCTPETETIVQSGLLHEQIGADPDGAGPKPSRKHQFIYDAAGREIATRVVGEQTDANWSCTTYDERGRVTKTTNRAGQESTVGYATPGVATKTYLDSAGAQRTTTSRVDWLGRPLSYTDELNTTTRVTYDDAGRVVDTYRQFSGGSDALLTRAAYDSATGRIASLTEYASSPAKTTTFTFDDAGRLKTTVRPNGVTSTNNYKSDRGWLESVTNKRGTTELSPWTYTRNASGSISREDTTIGGVARRRDFEYDRVGRLMRVTEGATVRNYSYDGNSNRCSTTTTCNGSYAYDDADRLTSSPFASSYTYDYRGNVTSAVPTATATTLDMSQAVSFDPGYSMTPQQFPFVVGQSGPASLTFDWTTSAPVNRASSFGASLGPAGTWDESLYLDGESHVGATLTWPKSNHQEPQNFVNQSVLAQGSKTHDVAPDAAGILKGTLSWNPTTTTGTWSGPSISTNQTYDRDITASSSGALTATVSWSSSLHDLDLYLYDKADTTFSNPLVSKTGVASTSETIGAGEFTVPASVTLSAKKTYVLRVKAKVSTGTTFSLTSTWPVMPDLDLEVRRVSNNALIGSSYATTNRPEIVETSSQSADAYRWVVISKDYPATYTLNTYRQMQAFADLEITLTPPGQSQPARSNSGATGNLALDGLLSSSGGVHAFHVQNRSTDLDAAITLSWSTTTLTDDTWTTTVAASQTAARPLTADDAGFVQSTMTWQQAPHLFGDPQRTGTLSAGATDSYTVSPTASGALTATVDWDPTVTPDANENRSVAALGLDDFPVTATGPGKLEATITWQPQGLINPDLDLYILDGLGNPMAASEQLTGNSEHVEFDVPTWVTYPNSNDYTIRVKSKSISSPYTLTWSKPVYDEVDLELWQGSTKLDWSYSTTSKPDQMSEAVSPGTYTVKVISRTHGAAYRLNVSYYKLGYASLALRIKQGATNVEVSGSTGVLTVSRNVAAGGFNVEVQNLSGDRQAPISVTTSYPKRRITSSARIEIKDVSGVTKGSAQGSSPLTATTGSLSPGKYFAVITPLTGAGSGTLGGEYQGGPPKLVIEYDNNDNAIKIEDGTTVTYETVAPSGRVLRRRVVDATTSETVEDIVYGYAGDSDSPAYSRPYAGGSTTTYLNGPGGLLVVDTGGTPTFPITNGHGDIVGTTDAAGAYTANPATDEFGRGKPAAGRLGFHGAAERFATGGTLGLVRMGVRLYDPNLGRFLQADPVEGGALNDYDYAAQDPINKTDLDGRAVMYEGGGGGHTYCPPSCIAPVPVTKKYMVDTSPANFRGYKTVVTSKGVKYVRIPKKQSLFARAANTVRSVNRAIANSPIWKGAQLALDLYSIASDILGVASGLALMVVGFATLQPELVVLGGGMALLSWYFLVQDWRAYQERWGTAV